MRLQEDICILASEFLVIPDPKKSRSKGVLYKHLDKSTCYSTYACTNTCNYEDNNNKKIVSGFFLLIQYTDAYIFF